MKQFLLIISLFFLVQLLKAQEPFDSFAAAHTVFRDTQVQIITDSFNHNMDTVEAVNSHLVKYFKYIGTVPAIITRTWTGDPHYICRYPDEPLVPGKIYSFMVCFHQEGRYGPFVKDMGFILNGETMIRFRFRGYVRKKE